jgi:uncharacterized OB-fold protein
MELNDAPVIGSIGPMHDGVDTEFWSALNRGKLKIQRCRSCQTWIWGAAWRCGHCGSWDIGWESVAPRGRVYSWIRTYQPFAPEIAPVVPFVTLLVELPQAGDRRVLGMLVGDETALAIGAQVEGVIQPPSEKTSGQPVLRWRLSK